MAVNLSFFHCVSKTLYLFHYYLVNTYYFLLGQTVRLRIPSELGYGAKGAGEVIPPNSDLVFRVVLESLKTEKVKIDRLSGTNCVNDKKTREKDVVTFNYIGYLEDGNNFWI